MDPFRGATITQTLFSQDNTAVHLLSDGLYAFVIRTVDGTITHVGAGTALRQRLGNIADRNKTAVRDTLPENQQKR